MFNLEAQIKAWRAQLIRTGLDNPQSITELEGHLREDVEQQIRLGASPHQALEGAAGRIGNVEALKREFAKAGPSRRLQISRLLGIACAALAGLFSLMLVPNIFGHHEASVAERLLGLIAIMLTLLSIPGSRHAHRFLPIIRNQRIRTCVGLACGCGGLLWMWFFIAAILPNLVQLPSASSDFPIGLILASVAWAFTLFAALGGIAYGLEEAARKRACD